MVRHCCVLPADALAELLLQLIRPDGEQVFVAGSRTPLGSVSIQAEGLADDQRHAGFRRSRPSTSFAC